MILNRTAFALAAAVATLAGVVAAEGAPASKAPPAEACAVGAPFDTRTQQQAGAAQTGGDARQTGPDGRGTPSPVGSVPAEPGAAPQAVITLSGSNLAAAAPAPEGTLPGLPAPCEAAPAARKVTKSRSNIQNN